MKKPRLLTPARSGLKPLSSPKTRPPCNSPFGQTARFFDALCRLPKLTGLQRLMLLAPMLRLFLLFLAAVTGLEFLAVLALLEPYALLHPRLLPAALVRAAFLR